MNKIELILQERADVFANFLKTHTISFLEKCTNEWAWKIWQENGDTTIPFNDFKRNLLRHHGNASKEYRYNGLIISMPGIETSETTRFYLIGRQLQSIDTKVWYEPKILLVFTIIPTTQRIQILGRWNPDAESLYHYLLKQIEKVYPDAPSVATAPPPIGINISNISSAGNLNINLSNVAGNDQISATSLPINSIYQELLQDGIKSLMSLSYDKAIVKLRKATELEDAETKAHYYLQYLRQK